MGDIVMQGWLEVINMMPFLIVLVIIFYFFGRMVKR